MNANQERVRRQIEYWSDLLGVDPVWACAIAMVESSMGEERVSGTNCRGIFQMSSIAMEDLRRQMGNSEDDLEILCGLLFLRLLYDRWGGEDEATLHYCDPADRDFYLDRVRGYMETFSRKEIPIPAPPVAAEYPVADKKPWWKRMWG